MVKTRVVIPDDVGSIPIPHPKQLVGKWCNGSTTPFDGVSLGSTPSFPARMFINRRWERDVKTQLAGEKAFADDLVYVNELSCSDCHKKLNPEKFYIMNNKSYYCEKCGNILQQRENKPISEFILYEWNEEIDSYE